MSNLIFVLSLWRTLTNTRSLHRPLTLGSINIVVGDEGQGVQDLLISAKGCGKSALAGARILGLGLPCPGRKLVFWHHS